MAALQGYGLYLAWLVATVATVGSLYFSEVRFFVPCPLCWYQRVLMYPLVILLGIASFHGDRAIVRYALPMSLLGAGIAFYHYLLQKLPGLGASPLCRVGVPCNVEYINWLGFITIPFLSLVAFTVISAILLALALQDRPAPTPAVRSGLR
jgi:disulfide bond formation protein DsbB